MTGVPHEDVSVGPYTGAMAEEYRDTELLSLFSRMPEVLGRPDSEVVAGGRNLNVKVNAAARGQPLALVVKSFGRQPLLKDGLDRFRGSKARRTWLAAIELHRRGVGTPPPVAFLERWRRGRLDESYYVAEYQDGVASFRNELIRLFESDPECERFMRLLQVVADAVRSLHAAGLLHNDLGNQNILLRRAGEADWKDVQFIDLNRARLKPALSLRQRARDLSRIYLPSDFLRVFLEMYFSGPRPLRSFRKWEALYRRLYALHAGTRRIRHPFRRARGSGRAVKEYPDEKDMWVWDRRSGQPINAMGSRDRRRRHRVTRPLHLAWAGIRVAPAVLPAYRALKESCYREPVAVNNRVGLAIDLRAPTLDREMAHLDGLGPLPLLVRFCRHDGPDQWRFAAQAARRLCERGHLVAAALVQDRLAVKDPACWLAFTDTVLKQIADFVDYVEVGHAINRVKWGVWDLDDHRRLLAAVEGIPREYPHVRLMGPAVIDFEYLFLAAALRNTPPGWRLAALSHHLYVDRRGAPENRQGLFSALEKFALARAMARCSSACEDRLVVSEVNWPLKHTGVYSPVGAPYVSPGPRTHDPSVDEDEYADYMIRYLVMAVASGMVERVYWWRLAARGFGLVDDSDADGWRKRPAYAALKYFMALLGKSVFEARRPLPPAAGRLEAGGLFVFRKPDGGRVCLGYSAGGARPVELPFSYERCVDAMGAPVPLVERSAPAAERYGPVSAGATVMLTGRPVYYLGVTWDTDV